MYPTKHERELQKQFYQYLKVAAKARKIKLSAEQDLYKKADPYFYHTFYHLDFMQNGNAFFLLDITVKYHRFDELEHGILHPGDGLKITDKLRANSGVKCCAAFPRINKEFDFDGREESLPALCETLLDYISDYSRDFLVMVEREYGDLDGYYIAHKEDNPRLAGLAYLDRGDYDGAIECFSLLERGNSSSSWIVHIENKEQMKRALANGFKPDKGANPLVQAFVKKTGLVKYSSGEGSFFRNRSDQFIDYAIALKNGLEWTEDMAMFGLLDEEKANKNGRKHER